LLRLNKGLYGFERLFDVNDELGGRKDAKCNFKESFLIKSLLLLLFVISGSKLSVGGKKILF
jgi:hypothetical protein